MSYRLTITHVDTCLPSYVLDHCNGDNEWLCGVVLSPNDRYGDVLTNLEFEARHYGDKLPSEISGAMARAAIAEMSQGVDKRKSFPGRPESNSEDGESVYAWFRFEWSTE